MASEFGVLVTVVAFNVFQWQRHEVHELQYGGSSVAMFIVEVMYAQFNRTSDSR